MGRAEIVDLVERWPIRAAACGADASCTSLVPTPGWSAALTRVAAGIQARRVIVLSGPAGAGKTSLLQCLVFSLRQAGRPAVLLRAGEPAPDRTCVVCMDDAHTLPDDALAWLARRPNGCVVAGFPNLRQRLEAAGVNPDMVAIPPIGPQDSADFVAGALRAAGEPVGLVSPPAIAALHAHGEGSPRRILALLRMAIFLARMEVADTVHPRHVDEAARVGDRVTLPDADEPAPSFNAVHTATPRRRARQVATALMLLAAIVSGGALIRLAWPTREVAEAIPPEAPTVAAVASQAAPRDPVELQPEPPSTPVLATLLPLPETNPLHVAVYAPAGDEAALARAGAIVKALRSQRYSVVEAQSALVRPQSLEVHYFFADDQDGASRLAAALEAGPSAVTLAPRAASVRPGRTEIWVPATKLAQLRPR